MIQITEKKKCNGCTACKSICPKNCIHMEMDATGFSYPKVDEENCIQCGLCELVCPNDKKNEYPDMYNQNSGASKAYAVCTADGTKRKKSASGGVFPTIASYILEQGGIVYGAQYESQKAKRMVSHCGAETEDALQALCNAKYVQSNLKDTFCRIGEQLKQGRTVMFTGTPCQATGLIHFLDKKNVERNNLFCVDTICHGVPSPKAWESYVKGTMQRDGKSVLPEFNMRDKSTGWSNYMASVSRKYPDGTEYVEEAAENSYMRAFMSNLSIRPSCSACEWKGYVHVSDMTIGDFWGVETLHKKWDDNKGISAVLIHSQKGKELFRILEERNAFSIHEPISPAEIAWKNRNLLEATFENKNRDVFLTQLTENNFEASVDCYAPKGRLGWLEKCLKTIRREYNKITLRKTYQS